MQVLQTARLNLRQIETSDAPFMLALLNDPDFMRFVGDRQVRDHQAAEAYIEKGPIASYEAFGYGLYLVELSGDRRPIGICGLLKRDYLDQADLGFALLPEYCGHGYAFEAAQGAVDLARERFRLSSLVAFCAAENGRSIRLLEKLGMVFARMIDVPSASQPLCLYQRSLL